MKGLFLDDERNPEDVTWNLIGSDVKYPSDVEWTIVRNSKDFIIEMEKDIYECYSFDHDIQDFWVQPKGTPLAQTAFGIVYAEEETRGEHTGYHCATHLQDHFMLGHGLKPKMFFVHSKNPVGAKKIYDLLIKII